MSTGPPVVEVARARRIALQAALLRKPQPTSDADGILAVARHFGGIQIDPTRTVERTQYLVLWSRLGGYDRDLLDRLLAARRLLEWRAFIVPLERLPEMLYFGRRWPRGDGNWVRRAREFLAGNDAFRRSILDQLGTSGPLQSRQIDDSKVKTGWHSTGWTRGKNTSQMLEFMSTRGEVLVSGRIGQERLWDIADRVIPPDAPRDELTEDQYEERRVMRAARRFGVATFGEIRLQAYGLSIPAAKALIARLTEEGRLAQVSLQTAKGSTPAWALPELLAASALGGPRTTLLSPFDPLVYDRERTLSLFDFNYRLEMYVPKEERTFGHFVLPIVHDDRLIGRLDSNRDRATGRLEVIRLHWEKEAPTTRIRAAVDQAIADLAEFVHAG